VFNVSGEVGTLSCPPLSGLYGRFKPAGILGYRSYTGAAATTAWGGGS
jgi:hypothetical protein